MRTMHDLVDLIRALAWPGVSVAVFLLLLPQLKLLFSALAAKIERASRIKIGKAGIELAEEIARGNILPPKKVDTAPAPEALATQFGA